MSPKTVWRARERLRLPQPQPRLSDLEVLRTVGPAATAQAFAERIGVQPAPGRKRLRELADAGLADVEAVQNGRGRTKLYTARTAK